MHLAPAHRARIRGGAGQRSPTLPRCRVLRSSAAAAGGSAAPAAAAAAAAHNEQEDALPSDPSFAPLVAWLERAGGSARGLDLRLCRMGAARVRGLVATAPAAAGDVLLSVPLSRALADDAVPAAFPGAHWAASMAAFLLEEAAKGTASDWAPYIASLPCGHLLAPGSDGNAAAGSAIDAGALLLSEAEVDAVQYAPAAAALRDYQARARRAFEAWRAAAAAAAAAPSAAAAGCPWERFALALHLVQSRTIRLAIAGRRVMIPGVPHAPRSLLAHPQASTPALAPPSAPLTFSTRPSKTQPTAIDCLNHGGSAGATGALALGSSSWALGGERAVSFVASRAVAAGEQVLWTYGDRSSEDFFAFHGFVLPGNGAREEVALWGGVEELAAWFGREGRRGAASGGGSDSSSSSSVAGDAARRAAQTAAIACGSPHVPGTTSWLLAPLALAGGAVSSGGSGGEGSSSSSSEGALDRWLRSLKQASGVERRLASLRLHLPEWGTDACAPSPPELSACGDGRCDVRLSAALVALCADAAAADDGGGGAARAAEAAAAELVRRRAAQLLAAFPTTAAEDEALLGGGAMSGSAMMREVVAFRLAKKRVLQQLAAGGGDGSGSGGNGGPS